MTIPPDAWHQRTATKMLVAVAVLGTICVPMMIGGTAAFSAVLRLPLSGYISIVALMSFNWLARTFKLLCLSRRLRVRSTFARMLAVSLATDFGFMVTPAGVGGYAASVHFLRRIGASASGAAAITAADQLLDVLFFVLAVPLAAISLGAMILPRVELSGLQVALLLALPVAISLLLWRGYQWALRGGRSCPAELHRGAVALQDFAARTRSDMRLLLTGGAFFSVGVLSLTILQQVSRYGVLGLIFSVLGFDVPFAFVFVLQTLVVQAAALTGIPAGGGAAEIGLSASFSQWIPSASLATALVIWRAATLYLGLIVGAIAIVWLVRHSPERASTEPVLGETVDRSDG